jgi:MFS family permease
VDQTIQKSTAPVGYLELVRTNASFRYLWFGQIISLLGDWFNLIASASLIAVLTESGLAVGGLFVVRMLAQFFASPVGGVLADRYNRKNLLILTDLLRAFIVLGFLLVRKPDDVWLMYVLTALQLAFSGIFIPTRDSILPDIVTSAELGAANALNSITWSSMLAFGAALGGIVAGEWGLRPAFVIDSLTFFISAMFISRVNYQQITNPHELDRRIFTIITQYVEGLRYLRDNWNVLVVALQKTSLALSVTSIFQIIQVSLASQIFVIGEGGSTSLGILYAVMGVGTGSGPILARIVTRDRENLLRRAIALGYLISAFGLLVTSTLASFPLVLFGGLLRGIGGSIGWVFSTQLLLQLVPNRIRGRVFSTEYALLTLANAIGAGLGGWALDSLNISIPHMLWGMLILTLILGVFWSLTGLLRVESPSKISPETG